MILRLTTKSPIESRELEGGSRPRITQRRPSSWSQCLPRNVTSLTIYSNRWREKRFKLHCLGTEVFGQWHPDCS